MKLSTMLKKSTTLLATLCVATTLTGCAAYRVDSNINTPQAVPTATTGQVLITEGIPNVKFREVSPVEVSVKKLTIFHKDPSREQANEALKAKALAIGADAVINVKYESGIGLMTWGYIDAKGTGVKLEK